MDGIYILRIRVPVCWFSHFLIYSQNGCVVFDKRCVIGDTLHKQHKDYLFFTPEKLLKVDEMGVILTHIFYLNLESSGKDTHPF